MASICVTKRKNKSGIVWQYRFEIGSVNGKRQWESKSGFPSKREAQEAGRKAQQLYENSGRIIKQEEMTYSDLLDSWIENDAAQTCKPNTVNNYQKKIHLYIKPSLGKYRIRSITKQNIKDFLIKLYNEGFSFNTISVCKGILTKSFKYAVDCNFLAASPANDIRMPKKDGLPPKTQTRTKPHVYIPKEKMEEIFDRFPEGTSCHLAMKIGYHCGLRIGEVFGLTWEDIDLEAKTLSVNRQLQWMKNNSSAEIDGKKLPADDEVSDGYWYFAEPKYNSYRVIDIDDTLAALLAREKNKAETLRQCTENYNLYFSEFPLNFTGVKPDKLQPFNKIDKNGNFEIHFVNVRKNGAYVTPKTFKHPSSVIHHQLNFPEFDFHSLRHTHATMLSECGAPMVYIQKRLGHAKADMTTNIYTNHLTSSIKMQGNAILTHIYND